MCLSFLLFPLPRQEANAYLFLFSVLSYAADSTAHTLCIYLMACTLVARGLVAHTLHGVCSRGACSLWTLPFISVQLFPPARARCFPREHVATSPALLGQRCGAWPVGVWFTVVRASLGSGTPEARLLVGRSTPVWSAVVKPLPRCGAILNSHQTCVRSPDAPQASVASRENGRSPGWQVVSALFQSMVVLRGNMSVFLCIGAICASPPVISLFSCLCPFFIYSS